MACSIYAIIDAGIVVGKVAIIALLCSLVSVPDMSIVACSIFAVIDTVVVVVSVVIVAVFLAFPNIAIMAVSIHALADA